MQLSLQGRPERAVAKAVVRKAVECGITLIDTANVYALDHTEIGHNERLIAEALFEMGISPDGTAGRGGTSVVVATKGGRTRPGGRWERDGRPEQLKDACHASLRALGVERIALYHLHAPDPAVPFAESVGMLARLRDEGKIHTIGLSNVSVDQVKEARRIVPVASVQNAYGPWDIGYRRPQIVEYCCREGILFLAYSPLGGSGRVASLGSSPTLTALATVRRATPQELILAWLVSEWRCVVPIPGATRLSSVESSVRAASLTLTPNEVRRIKRALRRLPGTRGLIERLISRLKRA